MKFGVKKGSRATRLQRARAMERNEQSREPVTIRVIATSKFKKTKSRIPPETLSTFKKRERALDKTEEE